MWATGGQGLPWEPGLATIRSSVSGPVAYGMAVMGIVVAGGTAIWQHHEPGHFGKIGFGLAMGSGIALGSTGMLAALYPAAGALI